MTPLISPLYSARRSKIISRVIHRTSRHMQDKLYNMLWQLWGSYDVDGVTERVKDKVWGRLPGEGSAP